MKLGLTERSWIKFNKLNSLQRHGIARSYRILHRVLKRLFQHNLKLRKEVIQIKLLGMPMVSHYTKFRLSTCNTSWAISVKRKVNFNIQPPSMLLFFKFSLQWSNKSCSSSEVGMQTFIAPRWLVQVSHSPKKFESPDFGIVEATWLETTATRSPSIVWYHYKVRKNLLIG
jgi:hypothetical protein